MSIYSKSEELIEALKLKYGIRDTHVWPGSIQCTDSETKEKRTLEKNDLYYFPSPDTIRAFYSRSQKLDGGCKLKPYTSLHIKVSSIDASKCGLQHLKAELEAARKKAAEAHDLDDL